MTSAAGRRPAGTAVAARLLLRALLVAGLVVDAVVHLRLAAGYQQGSPGGLGEGNLFRLQAGAAAVLAVAVAVRATRTVLAAALLVAAAALVAVVLYTYVDVPAFGPIPSMHEPVWFPQKTYSAVAEGVAVLSALVLLAWSARDSPRRSTTGGCR